MRPTQQDVGDERRGDRNIYCSDRREPPNLLQRSRRMGREASRTRIETRSVERGGRLVEAVAPAHWTVAQLDAWIDWAAPEGGGASINLPAIIETYVEEL